MKRLDNRSVFFAFLADQRGNMNFTESLALKVVSLLLALILWITILGFKKEEMTKSVKFEPMLPPGKVLVTRIPSHIQLTIVGPRVLLKEVENRLQPIRPDLRNARDNKIPLSIAEELLVELPLGVKVPTIQPREVILHLEDLIEKEVPVRANTVGAPPEGVEVAALKANPSKVSVTGPRSVIENLTSVSTEPILLQDIGENTTREVTVEVDAAQGLQLSRQRVVAVRITLRKARK